MRLKEATKNLPSAWYGDATHEKRRKAISAVPQPWGLREKNSAEWCGEEMKGVAEVRGPGDSSLVHQRVKSGEKSKRFPSCSRDDDSKCSYSYCDVMSRFSSESQLAVSRSSRLARPNPPPTRKNIHECLHESVCYVIFDKFSSIFFLVHLCSFPRLSSSSLRDICALAPHLHATSRITCNGPIATQLGNTMMSPFPGPHARNPCWLISDK